LEEYDASRADGDVFNVKDGLNGQKGYLDAQTRPDASNYLVAKPFGEGGINIEGRYEPTTDGEEDAADNEEGGLVANDCDQPAGYN